MIANIGNMAVAVLERISKDYDVYSFTKSVLTDERFPLWSGSSRKEQHHYGKSGLAIHTHEVVELCLQSANYFDIPQIQKQMLLIAAIFHDAGKMWDYQPIDITDDFVNNKDGSKTIIKHAFQEWKSSDHKYRIHHITRSALCWNDAFYSSERPDWLDNETSDEITHAILAHHGRKEWGSPVEPKSKIAWILHTCDMMSARVFESK